MPKKKTHEEFEKEVLEIGKGEYELLSNYVNTRTKLWMKHISCGHEYQMMPEKFLLGRRCPNCSKGFCKRKTHEDFSAEVFEYGKGEYEILSPYQNNNTYIKMKHLPCGHVYDVRPKKFSEGRRCPKCSSRKAKPENKFKEEVERIGKGEYELLSPYLNHKAHVVMRHTACGQEYKVRPTNFLQGSRCLHCFGTPAKTHEEFLKEVEDIGGGRYELLSKYTLSREYVKMKHLDCGHEYKVRASQFSSGVRCSKCISSKGEKLIENLLKTVGLSYEREFSFPECKNVRPLRFDFCVKNPDGSILMLIEFDGIQHYEENARFGGRKGYLRRVKNDRIKSNFAKSKAIPLLRIRYDQKHPEQLLLKVLEHVQHDKKSQDNRAS